MIPSHSHRQLRDMECDKCERKKKECDQEDVHLYVMWPEEKLTIEVGLFYKVWIRDADLRIDRCRMQSDH